MLKGIRLTSRKGGLQRSRGCYYTNYVLNNFAEILPIILSRNKIMINIGGLVCTKLSIFNDEFALANTVPNKHL